MGISLVKYSCTCIYICVVYNVYMYAHTVMIRCSDSPEVGKTLLGQGIGLTLQSNNITIVKEFFEKERVK